MKSKGLLTAGALVLTALYVMSDEDEPFTATFLLESLPLRLRQAIEKTSDGMLVTVSKIHKGSDFVHHNLTDKEFQAIILNKQRDEFGLRETIRRDGEDVPTAER